MAQIFDQGYRRYDGPRTGVTGASRSLIGHSARSALGLGRSARHKVIPFLLIIFSFLPAVVFVGVAALFPEELDGFLPTYAEYYGFVVAAIYLFAGFVAPQLLCVDRRTGLLGVYLASPLNRVSYLISKGITILAMMLVVTLGPTMLTLIAYSLQESGPDGFTTWIGVFFKVIASSLVIAIIYAAVAIAISSTTDRWVVATGSTLAVISGLAIVTDTLVLEADMTHHLRLFNVLGIPRDLIFRIHGETPIWTENPTWTVAVAWLVWVVASLVFCWWSYRRLLVRR